MAAFTEADRRKILESLTADELETFKEAFTVFDKNQDGTITTKVRSHATHARGPNEALGRANMALLPLSPTNQSRLSALNLLGPLTRFMAAIARPCFVFV